MTTPLLRRPVRAANALCLAACLLTGGVDARGLAAGPACALRAYIADPDRTGTNVRAGPSPHAAIVAHLPHDRSAGGDRFAPELEIIGFERGWAKVRMIRFADYGDGEAVLFAGTGWISGRLLSAELTRMPVPELDDARAGPMARADASAGSESAVVEAIDDCSGTSAHVVARLADGRRVAGWTTGLCANQATTCS